MLSWVVMAATIQTLELLSLDMLILATAAEMSAGKTWSIDLKGEEQGGGMMFPHQHWDVSLKTNFKRD